MIERRRTRTPEEHAALLAHLTRVGHEAVAAHVSDLANMVPEMRAHEAAVAGIASQASAPSGTKRHQTARIGTNGHR